MSDLGHNHIEAAELKLLIERVERIAEEKKELSAMQSDVYREAKSRGYDTKAMREVVRLRKMDPETRTASEDLRQAYKDALSI